MANKNRIKYTAEQLLKLEDAFTASQYPDTVTMETLAMDLDVNVDRISIWFQNRRSKFKRQSKNTHINWMRDQIFDFDVTSGTRTSSHSTRHVLSAPYSRYGRHHTNQQKINTRVSAFEHFLQTPITIPTQPEVHTADQTGSIYTTDNHRALMMSHLLTDPYQSPGCMYQEQAAPSCLYANQNHNSIFLSSTSSVPYPSSVMVDSLWRR